MKHTIVLIFFALTAAHAQINGSGGFGAVISDLKGSPIVSGKNSDVEGSPFLNDFWLNGELTLRNGSLISNVPLRFNMETKEIHFLKKDDDTNRQSEIIIQSGMVTSFKLFEPSSKNLVTRTFKSGFPPIDGIATDHYFEVVVEGAFTLLKYNSKRITEDKPFNSAVSTKKFVESESYYFFCDNRIVKIRKGREFILESFKDHSLDLERFLSENKIKCKSLEDWVRVANFINGL